MQDIADKAGVTKTTVSLALRGDRRISVKTRDRIGALAKEMGYRPNPMVATLMAQVQAGKGVSQGTRLALLAPPSNREKSFKSPHAYSREIYAGLEARAQSLGYRLEVIEPEEKEKNFNTCVRIMQTRGIRGVLLPPFLSALQHFNAEVDCEGFSVVAVGYSQRIEGVHRVAHSQFRIAYRLTSEALARGYRRIGMHLSPDMNDRTGHKYPGGFLGALCDHEDVSLSREHVLFTRGEAAPFLSWVKSLKPDAILTQYPSDYQILRDAGYQIPGDMGFALLSTTEGESFMSGCYHDPSTLAAAAVDLVTSHLMRNETGKPIHPKTVLTPEDWVEGETL